ncbi:uncharacterized protein LOC129725900 isoform X2 [Wyeomyia smithii]|uniref:uncharacterized protein LOC129725900 isoform X2 n=2 Tax=Wyeomyia smithii TaxID=174621 RepID=UPI002467D16F|nr:uncharacterized protein LOC129725900 isoform X2 [Wyeomyia smithii]
MIASQSMRDWLKLTRFSLIIMVVLRRGRIQTIKHSQTVQHAWNICFYIAATIFLNLYHKLLIRPEIAVQSSKYFPQYNNTIFLTACDIVKFEIVTMVLVAFVTIDALARLSNTDYLAAIQKICYISLLLCCFVLRLENYSVLLNTYLGVFNAFQEVLLLLSLHTNQKSDAILKLFVIFICSSWSYIFLKILPFEFLIPSLYANNKDLHLYLNIVFWVWYCLSIWNSPILKFLYHKIYHSNPYDCVGGELSLRCILLGDSRNYRHYRNLERAFLEIKLFYSNGKLSGVRHSDIDNTPAKAYQTIKCVLALKRKLRKIRENRDQLLED